MTALVYALPGNEDFAQKLTDNNKMLEPGNWEFRHFPDGECYVRFLDYVKSRSVIFICSLNQPDKKILLLVFAAEAAREQGAAKIVLVAPYLAYLRQDKRFRPGEALTSVSFAKLLSQYFSWLVTVDPHLHRIGSLSDIYNIQTYVVQSAGPIYRWCQKYLSKPLFIGPDSESEQWVSQIAKNANAPYIVLSKNRLGDKNIKLTFPDLSGYEGFTFVLVDDIASTAQTLITAVKHLKRYYKNDIYCIVVHPIFAGNSFLELQSAGAKRIISCNTISHPSNTIFVTDEVTEAVVKVLKSK